MDVQIMRHAHVRTVDNLLLNKIKIQMLCTLHVNKRKMKNTCYCAFFHTSFNVSMGYINALNNKKTG